HHRERAVDGHQSVRGRGGEGLAVRPVRSLARLSQLLAGRVLRHGPRLCRALQATDRSRRARGRGARMEHDTRRTIGPRRVAVRAGSGRQARARSGSTRLISDRWSVPELNWNRALRARRSADYLVRTMKSVPSPVSPPIPLSDTINDAPTQAFSFK